MSSHILTDGIHKIPFLELFSISRLICSMPIHDEEEDDVYTQVTEPARLRCLSRPEPHNSTAGTTLQALRRWGGTASPTCKYRGDLVQRLLEDASRTC